MRLHQESIIQGTGQLNERKLLNLKTISEQLLIAHLAKHQLKIDSTQ